MVAQNILETLISLKRETGNLPEIPGKSRKTKGNKNPGRSVRPDHPDGEQKSILIGPICPPRRPDYPGSFVNQGFFIDSYEVIGTMMARYPNGLPKMGADGKPIWFKIRRKVETTMWVWDGSNWIYTNTRIGGLIDLKLDNLDRHGRSK